MIKPYGTWPSPITAAAVAAQGVRLSNVALDGGHVYWLEGRPLEGGRHVLVRRTAAGDTHDVVSDGFNVRTRVHEYGGGAFAVRDGVVCFANFEDQRLYVMAPGNPSPRAITPAGSWCYADGVIDPRRRQFVCVREDRTGAGEPVNAIVTVPLERAVSTRQSPITVVASGFDFYAAPRLSPDGTRLAWICWNHPQMPWDGTELWVADVAADGSLDRPRRIAGGPTESVYQPGWSSDGHLYFVSDRTGWWQLYRVDSPDGSEPAGAPVIANPPADAEFGRAMWALGTQTWVCAGTRLVVSYTTRGRWWLATVDLETGLLQTSTPRSIRSNGSRPTISTSSSWARLHGRLRVVRIQLEGAFRKRSASPRGMRFSDGFLSPPEAIAYESSERRTVHAFYYAPTNSNFEAPAQERPPLIVISHGGPTTATSATLDLRVQFWTSRGFAVVDVNYGGSTGYGRSYRERLRATWGLVDVDDVLAAARTFPRRAVQIPGASSSVAAAPVASRRWLRSRPTRRSSERAPATTG